MKPFTERKKGGAGIGLWEEENEFSLGSVVSRVYSFSIGDIHRQINGTDEFICKAEIETEM